MNIGATDRIAVQPIANGQSPAFGRAGTPAAPPGGVEPIRFTNPGVSIDKSGLVIIQFRDTSTGEVELQIPSARAVQAYRADREQRQAEFRAKLFAPPPELPKADPPAEAPAGEKPAEPAKAAPAVADAPASASGSTLSVFA